MGAMVLEHRLLIAGSAVLGLAPFGPLRLLRPPLPGLGLFLPRLLALLGLPLPRLFPGRPLRSLFLAALRMLLRPGLLATLVLLLHGLSGAGVLLLHGERWNDGSQQQEHDSQTVRSIGFHDGHLHQDGWLRPPERFRERPGNRGGRKGWSLLGSMAPSVPHFKYLILNMLIQAIGCRKAAHQFKMNDPLRHSERTGQPKAAQAPGPVKPGK